MPPYVRTFKSSVIFHRSSQWSVFEQSVLFVPEAPRSDVSRRPVKEYFNSQIAPLGGENTGFQGECHMCRNYIGGSERILFAVFTVRFVFKEVFSM